MTMETEQENKFSGFLLINKPTGSTSFYCIKKIKTLLDRKEKVGHAGTLDSFAAGLLIIGVGRPATRMMSQMMKLDKIYVAQGKLGQLTDTLDFTGELLEDNDPGNITEQQLQEAIDSLGTSYKQIPPIYSALKFKGLRLSQLARTGRLSDEELEKVVEEKARTINLYELTLLELKLPFFTVCAHVSHGTYVRALVNDIAQKVGSCATTHALERTQIGPFTLEEAVDFKKIQSFEDVEQHIISIEEIQRRLQEYTV